MADMKLAMRENATGMTLAPRSAMRNSLSVFCLPPLNLKKLRFHEIWMDLEMEGVLTRTIFVIARHKHFRLMNETIN